MVTSDGVNAQLSAARIRAAEEALGARLPAFYANFLRRTDGLGPEGSVVLYSTDDLAERNETFEVQAYAPGFLAIGDDGGGRSLLIALDGSTSVFIVDQGSMDPDDFEEVAPDFTDWIERGMPLPGGAWRRSMTCSSPAGRTRRSPR